MIFNITDAHFQGVSLLPHTPARPSCLPMHQGRAIHCSRAGQKPRAGARAAVPIPHAGSRMTVINRLIRKYISEQWRKVVESCLWR